MRMSEGLLMSTGWILIPVEHHAPIPVQGIILFELTTSGFRTIPSRNQNFFPSLKEATSHPGEAHSTTTVKESCRRTFQTYIIRIISGLVSPCRIYTWSTEAR